MRHHFGHLFKGLSDERMRYGLALLLLLPLRCLFCLPVEVQWFCLRCFQSATSYFTAESIVGAGCLLTAHRFLSSAKCGNSFLFLLCGEGQTGRSLSGASPIGILALALALYAAIQGGRLASFAHHRCFSSTLPSSPPLTLLYPLFWMLRCHTPPLVFFFWLAAQLTWARTWSPSLHLPTLRPTHTERASTAHPSCTHRRSALVFTSSRQR